MSPTLRLVAMIAGGLVVLAALTVFASVNWPSALERQIALRYLRSRRSSRLLSLITVIAVGGVTVGVMALVVVLGVMNGLQTDLREKILVANPHLRILTYDRGLRLDDWRRVLDTVRRTPGVEAVAPFVMSQIVGTSNLGGAGQSTAFSITSSGLIIVVGVVLDTLRQIEAQLLMRQYEGFIR